MRLKLNEAIAQSEVNGKKVLKQDLALKLFPDANKKTRQVNMTNLCNGRTKRVSVEQVRIICEMLNCTADYLFNI
jgi:hypothetical protein